VPRPTAACGAAMPPGELVPTLRRQLTQVDQALAAGDYPQARDALDTLAEQTATARDEGRITPDQADRILTAMTRVAANLPEPTVRRHDDSAQPAVPTRTRRRAERQRQGERQRHGEWRE
jgi:hypothetical protein